MFQFAVPTRLSDGRRIGQTRFEKVERALDFFPHRDRGLAVEPRLQVGPLNLLPIAGVEAHYLLAEINPNSPTCRIWVHHVEDGEAHLLLDSIAELIEFVADDLNVTDPKRFDGYRWFDGPELYERHPEYYDDTTGMPSTSIDLYESESQADFAANRWPDFWIARSG